MSDLAFIRDTPCGHCDWWRCMDRETGFYGCKLHPAGDTDWCEPWQATREISIQAAQVARIIAGWGRASTRRAVAEAAADGFANALCEVAPAAILDEAAFLDACRAREKAVSR